MKQGVPTVLLGKPNVGKSSLLNALLGYDRAIVTDVAGTTRDTVEEKLALGHVLLRLTDTAGIRESGDAVERLGVARSRAAAERAALAILLLDGSAPPDEQDEEAIAVAESVPYRLVVVNKSDLPRQADIAALTARFGHVLSVSAKTGEGVAALGEAIAALFPAGTQAQGQLLTNARQADAVRRALEGVQHARAALESGRVERVLFLPTGNPPHKKEGLADKFDRLRMVELAVEHEAGMAVCREEIDRDGVIYTVDTLAALKRKMPDCTLTYLIGADTLRALGTWRRVETVIERCKFLVMMREGETREEVIRLAGLWTQRGAQIDFLDARKMDISSTQIREQIQKGLPFERLVPQAVADYIHEHGLYGAKTGMELNR